MEQTGSEWKETGSEITIREIVSWLTLLYLYCRIILWLFPRISACVSTSKIPRTTGSTLSLLKSLSNFSDKKIPNLTRAKFRQTLMGTIVFIHFLGSIIAYMFIANYFYF